MNPLRLIMLPFSRRVRARLRGLWWSLRYRTGSSHTVVWHPLYITPRCLRLGHGVNIFANGRIEGVTRYLDRTYSPLIQIASGASIGQNCHITCANSISIGENTAVAANVTITDIDHPYEDVSLPVEHQRLKVKDVAIGPDCKIYNNAVILPGVHIGKHCVVGANSVVNRDLPDYSVAAGAPARIIRRYDFDRKEWRRTDKDGKFI